MWGEIRENCRGYPWGGHHPPEFCQNPPAPGKRVPVGVMGALAGVGVDSAPKVACPREGGRGEEMDQEGGSSKTGNYGEERKTSTDGQFLPGTGVPGDVGTGVHVT